MTLEQAIEALDNLAESWKQVGRPHLAKAMAEAVAVIKAKVQPPKAKRG